MDRRDFVSGSLAAGLLTAGISVAGESNQGTVRNNVNVHDFMTAAQIADAQSGSPKLDATASFTAAQNAGSLIFIPAGVYLLNNFRYRTGKVFYGEGYTASVLKQANPAMPAINCLADSTTGQLLGVGLLQVGVSGASRATVAAVQVSATAPFVVYKSRFDFDAIATYGALKITCTDANEVYDCEFRVTSSGTTSYAFTTSGTYNKYDLFAVNCTGSVAVSDTSLHSVFNRVVGDGTLIFGGQNCTILAPTVEDIYGNPTGAAIYAVGYNNTLINPALNNVPAKKITNAGIVTQNNNIFINLRIFGTNYPTYPVAIAAKAKPTFINSVVSSTYTLDQYVDVATLQGCTFIGDCSTLNKATASRAGFIYSYQTPAGGFAITVADNTDALVLEPVGNLATGSITMPSAPRDRQIVRISSTKKVTALTILPNAGQAIDGTPATIAAGGSFAFVFRAKNKKWYPTT
ncbi:MAG TPA: hypothetical protein VFK88_12260 [Gallionella sp.]|nr:hypothetical protein [Gallionella sp.]